ncbi:class I SAM-dependent methyltransferase [Aeromicrobium duanguangcaii]|uniref:Class I SAM-dependent methyltransferase n=1 Tax=Aeromicrobium duanguangcaii TaxID=2968086 RepID=A0ABY5KBZ2_9ACTN|nr:class I SAM-dependent methyltransferase [Aeromicrobium duanguangcaii]MCL3837364.1 class I SAM-dependent methyltransferase [Aeromicrobium duanguangcaii]UUI67395.1 class I SAM-dependent methyltransferase [Aeromicrobium duanguangcaii]
MNPDGLARSVRLFRSFLVEQTDPDHFYGTLARDSADLVEQQMSLDGKLVIDVGAGPVQFAQEFRGRGARYVAVDLDPEVSALADGGVAADAALLPFATGSADLVFSSNLLEHVRDPGVVAAELVRVARPGGLVFLSYTNWWSPWGGHETSPWHWLGGRRAIERYTRREGHPPKNRVGETLFKISVAWGMRWARRRDDVRILAARPRYLPRWAAPLVRVPGVREVLSWNLLLLLRREDANSSRTAGTPG